MSPNGEAAVQYARAGWPVFPARPGRPGCPAPGKCTCKAPVTMHGVDDATTDVATVERYWHRHPDSNVAIATGEPGPVVLDVDVAHGRPGYASLNEAIRAGLIPRPMATVRTLSGGVHLYFAATPGQRNGSLPDPRPGLAGRARLCPRPPSSVHGRPYEFSSRVGSPLTIDFERLRDHFQPAASRTARQPRDRQRDTFRLAGGVARLQPGNRNSGLWWAAWRAAQAGDHDVIDQIAQAALTTGLHQREIDRTIASARHPAAHPRRQTQREAG